MSDPGRPNDGHGHDDHRSDRPDHRRGDDYRDGFGDDYRRDGPRERYPEPSGRDDGRYDPRRDGGHDQRPPAAGGYGDPYAPGHQDPRHAGGYHPPHPGLATHVGPGYGAPPHPGAYAPPHPGAYAPPPYAPPRRRKSLTPLIIGLCAGFAYLMFFILYFSGTLDRMVGRVANFPAEMQGAWCWAGNTPTDSAEFRIEGSRLTATDVTAGQRTEQRRILRGITNGRYRLQNVTNGNFSVWTFRIDAAGKLQHQAVEVSKGTPDTQEFELQRCP